MIGAVVVYPILDGVRMSFLDFKLTAPGQTPFIGVDNYVRLFNDPIFWAAAKNTVIWTVANLVAQMILGTALALFLNERLFARGLFRSVALIPWIVPSVVAVLIWQYMYDPSTGLVNSLLFRLGLIDHYIPWLGQTNTAMPAVIAESVWKGTPFVMIIILAALQGIPRDLYEAAAVDGAGSIQRFRYIVFPLIRRSFFLAAILTIVFTVNNFNAIWIMTQGGPIHSTEILFTYAYKIAFQRFDFGEAAALSVILFLVLLSFATTYVLAIERGEERER